MVTAGAFRMRFDDLPQGAPFPPPYSKLRPLLPTLPHLWLVCQIATLPASTGSLAARFAELLGVKGLPVTPSSPTTEDGERVLTLAEQLARVGLQFGRTKAFFRLQSFEEAEVSRKVC